MTPMELLTRFCGRHEPREWMRTTFLHGEYAYATDGRIIVRMPADGLSLPVLDAKHYAPQLDRLFDAVEGSFFPMPHLPPWVLCALCNGSGHVCDKECEKCGGDGGNLPCKACLGTGRVACALGDDGCQQHKCIVGCDGLGIQSEAIPVGDAHFNLAYLLAVADLPGVLARGPAESMAFRFDGGDGRLMPLWARARPGA